jgi:hypothetical protein
MEMDSGDLASTIQTNYVECSYQREMATKRCFWICRIKRMHHANLAVHISLGDRKGGRGISNNRAMAGLQSHDGSDIL